MVVFVDLDHDTFSKNHFPHGPDALPHHFAEPEKLTLSKLMVVGAAQSAKLATDDDTSIDPTHDASQFRLEEQNQNQNAFSVALGCYPYATLENQATLRLVRYCSADWKIQDR